MRSSRTPDLGGTITRSNAATGTHSGNIAVYAALKLGIAIERAPKRRLKLRRSPLLLPLGQVTDCDESRTRGVTRNARTLTERDVSHRGGPVDA